jgi:AcrR family transcriptional regulator
VSRTRIHAKRAYHHGNLREGLIAAALQIIGKQGAKGLTLRRVARVLGVSQTAPYRHFRSKEALLAAIAAEGFRALGKVLEAGMQAAGSNPIDRFRAIGLAYLRFGIEHPAHFGIMYSPRSEEFTVGDVADAGRAAFALTREAIERCQRETHAPAGDSSQIAVAAWSLVHGLVTLHHNGQLPRRCSPRRLRELASQITLFLEAGFK